MRARVSGYLEAVHFRDGQMVKKGDLLFTIDRRPFQASLAQAQANSRRPANLAFAGRPGARQGAGAGSTITQQTFDQRTQAKRVAAASVAAKRRPCARPSSIWNSPSCARRSPAASATGASRTGNLVTGGTAASTTLLATIVSIDPIRFEFTMDEASYLRYVRLLEAARKRCDRGIDVAGARSS